VPGCGKEDGGVQMNGLLWALDKVSISAREHISSTCQSASVYEYFDCRHRKWSF